MLVLTRKSGESILIGHGIRVTVVEIRGRQVQLGVDAPKELMIYREELYERILEENRLAAASSSLSLEDVVKHVKKA